MMYHYPFNVVTGSGLGVSHSSLTQIGDLWSGGGLGQASIKLFANAANGNLMVRDRVLPLLDRNGMLPLSYIYNSQANNSQSQWRLGCLKKLTTLPSSSNINKSNSKIILEEADGYLTTYNFDAKTNRYWGESLKDGTPYLQYDATNKQWLRYHPTNQTTEIFDAQGLLKQHTDLQGRTTNLIYNQGELTAIQCPSGVIYQPITQTLPNGGKQISWQQTKGSTINLLHTYQFNAQGQLIQSTTKDNYAINYHYDVTTHRLTQITQTDGTTCSVSFTSTNNILKLDNFCFGDNDFIRFNYGSNQTIISDPLKNNLTLTYDSQQRLIKKAEQRGYSNEDTSLDITTYTYTSNSANPSHGQLAGVTLPGGETETYCYDANFGHLIEKRGGSGQVKQYVYESGGDRPKLIAEYDYLNFSDNTNTNSSPLVTRYIYDTNYDHLNQRHTFLRFVLTPEGRVTEYRPDNYGNVSSQRCYRQAHFDLSNRNYDEVITLGTLQTWVSQQDPSQVILTEYHYNAQGQCTDQYEYANVDAQGQGVPDTYMTHLSWNWTDHGQWVEKIEYQTTTTPCVTRRDYDGLLRLCSETNALNETTQMLYHDNQRQMETIQPSGQTNVETWDTAGFITKHQEMATVGNQVQTRITTYDMDLDHRPVVAHRPDSQTVLQFFDHQNRLGFEVSALGIVKETREDRQTRSVLVITYANPVNVNALYAHQPPNPGELPSVDRLRQQLQTSANDRTMSQFKDLSGRLAYEVDSENYLIEYQYDALNRKTAKIAYATPISDAEWTALTQGQQINRAVNFTTDQCWQWLYNADSLMVGEIDPAGYYTQHDYDDAKIQWHTQRYAKALSSSQRWPTATVVPSASSQDVHTNYYSDQQGRVVLEVDSEGYITQQQFLGNDLVARHVRMQNTVSDPYWSVQSQKAPVMPISSAEDQTLDYTYDSLNRVVQQTNSNGQNQTIVFDIMGQKISEQNFDGWSNLLDGDHRRGKQRQYDGWEQMSAELNAAANLDLLQQPNNSQAIWQTESTRYVYDTTGLKLKCIAPNGAVTLYYYDADRRPVITINALGGVNAITLNAFGEPVQTRRYAQSLNSEQLSPLLGGFVDASLNNLLAQLQDDDHDAVESFTYDHRGLLIEKVDAENYQTNKAYDAFQRCVKEQLPVTQTAPSLTITHQFDVRNLEIQTLKSDGLTTQTITRSFDDVIPQVTSLTDEVGGQTQTIYDRLGRIIETQQTIDTNQKAIRTQRYDAINRVTEETDANQNTTTHQYNQQQRTHIVQPPIQNTQETFTLNTFSDIIARQDALGQISTQTHDALNNIITQTDANGNTMVDTYDVMNNHSMHQNEQGVQTTYTYNLLNYLEREIEDTQQAQLTTCYTRDVWGMAKTITDARRIETQYTYDCKDNQIIALRDPDGLALQVEKTYNGQKQLAEEQQGNRTQSNQYLKQTLIDGFGRNIGTCVDPNQLKLQTQKTLDAKGQVIAETISAVDDPASSTMRYWYDLRSKKRFQVNALGEVLEWCYDAQGQLIAEIHHINRVNTSLLNDQTTLSQLTASIQSSPDDFITRLFYDANCREQFRVTSTGKVTEKVFDNASRCQQTRTYATTYVLDATSLLNAATDQVVNWASLHQTADDRTNYMVFDAYGQERFRLDGENYVTETRYDACKRKIMAITYAIQQPDLVASIKLDDAAFAALVQKSPGVDKVEHWVYDRADRLAYTVNGDGLVTQFTHDEVDNETQVHQYATALPSIYDTTQLQTALSQLIATNQDRIKNKVYDAGNRLIEVIDEENNSEFFTVNSLGDVITHQDREGNITTMTFDGARRVIDETTPEIEVTEILENQGQLSDRTIKTTLTRHKNYDKFSNAIEVIEAYNTSAARKLISTYDLANRLIQTQLPGAVVDDPTQAASYTQRPEISVALTSCHVYDGKGQLVAEANEINSWRFYVFDADNRQRYLVEMDGAVTEYVCNTSGDVIEEIHYYNRLTIDLMQYTAMGIPQAVVAQAIVESDLDRHTFNTYDHRGDLIYLKKGPKFYYVIDDNGHVTMGTDYLQKSQTYNAFRQCILMKDLINPVTQSWAQQRLYYNLTNQLIGQVNANGYVKLYDFNAFNQEVHRIEYANAIQTVPDQTTSLNDIKSQLLTSTDDREFLTNYDRRGLKISETQCHVAVQSTQPDDNNQLQIIDISKDLTTSYTYNKNGAEISQTNAKGLVAYKYYNARSDVIAEVEYPMEAVDPNGQVQTLLPLCLKGIDYFGQEVKTTHYKYGTLSASADTIPTPYHASIAEDQITLKYLDNRNQTLYEQDANGHVEGYTYLATPGKKVRHWWRLTNLNEQNNQDITHIDEERKIYNVREQIVQELIYRDDQLQTNFSIERQWNAFGEKIKEGPGDGTFPATWDYDNTGACWRSNGAPDNGEDKRQKSNGRGEYTITLQDLRNFVTVNAKSATQDLGAINYSDLNQVMNWSIADLERGERVLDKAGNMRGLFMPAYQPSNLDETYNIPLNMTISSSDVKKKTTTVIDSSKTTSNSGVNQLSWTLQQERNVAPKFIIWPAQPNNATADPVKVELPITVNNGRCEVDLSSLMTDMYQYQIQYWLNNPLPDSSAPAQVPLYTTLGYVQIDNGINDASQNLVVKATNSDHIILSGKTANLSAINLLRNQEQIAQIRVPTQNQNNEITIDLSVYATGEYTIQPIYTDHQAVVPSLPFIIYTQTLSPTLFGEEVSGNCNLQTLDKYGQLTWNISSHWQTQPVMLSVTYVDDQGNDQTHTDIITLDTNLGEYQDNQGTIITCNTEFEYTVKQVKSISLLVQGVTEEDWIPLQLDYTPTVTTTSPDGNNNSATTNKTLTEKPIYSPRLQYHAPMEINADNNVNKSKSGIPEMYYVKPSKGLKKDSVLNAFKVSRQEFVEILLKVNDKKILQDIHALIRDDIKNMCFNLQFERARRRLNQLHEIYQIKNKQDFNKTCEILLQNRQGSEASALMSAQADFLQYGNTPYFKAHAENADHIEITEETVRYYLEQFQEHKTISWPLAKCFAQVKQLNVTLWTRQENHALKLNKHDFYEACNSQISIHLYDASTTGDLIELQAVGIPLAERQQAIAKYKEKQLKKTVLKTSMNQEKQTISNSWTTWFSWSKTDNHSIMQPVNTSTHLMEDWLDTNTHEVITTVDEDPIEVDARTQSYDFAKACAMYLRASTNPFAQATQVPEVKLKDTNLDRLATWNKADVSSMTSDGLVIDVTGLVAGYYPLQITTDDQQTKDYSMTVTDGSWVYPSLISTTALKAEIIQPKYTFEYDGWANKITEISPLNHKTTHSINPLNKEIKRMDPETTVVDEQGNATRQITAISWGYDELEHKIASKDQNNCVEGYSVDAEDKLLRVYNANNEITEENQRDLFGNIFKHYDWSRRLWQRSYDRNNNMLQQITPGNDSVMYTYNEVGLPNSKKDEAGYLQYFGLDALKNVIYRTQPLDQRVDLVIDRNGQTLSERYSDGRYRQWTRDSYFDVVNIYQDFSGTQYTYSYDKKLQIIHETSNSINHGKMLYQERYSTTTFNYTYDSAHQTYIQSDPILTTFYSPHSRGTPGRDLTYTYVAGRLVEVWDGSQSQRSRFGYDIENRQVTLKLWDANGCLVRDVTCQYDELNRELITYDTQMTQWTGYDAKGNRRHIYASVYTDPLSLPMTQDQWFTYSNDGKDFVIIDGGTLNQSNQIIIGNGRQYDYNQGYRVKETRNDGVSTSLTYDAEGRFNGTTSTDGNWTTRVYDVRGLMTQYRDKDTTINNGYNQNGWMTSTNQIQGSSNTTTTYSNFDAMGNAWHQRLDYDGGYDDLNQSYVGYDSLCAYDLVGTRYNKYGAGPASSVGMRYGANGGLSGVYGIYNDLNEQDKDAIPETLIVVSDYSGLTYGRRLLPVGINGNSATTEWTRYFFTANKNYIGCYVFSGAEQELQVPGNTYIGDPQLSHQTSTSGGQEVGYDSSHGGSTVTRTRTTTDTLTYDQQFKSGSKTYTQKHTSSNKNTVQEAMTLADQTPPVSGWGAIEATISASGFKSSSYMHNQRRRTRTYFQKGRSGFKTENKDNTSFPASSPTTYIAAPGDNYAQIASKQYGDPDCGGTVDTANGLTPYPGYPIIVPAMLPTRNNNKTFIPQHEIMEFILADISFYPRLMSHQPKKKHSWWSFVMIVVSVAIAIFAPELCAIAISALASALSVGEAVATAIVMGAVAATTTAALEGIGSILGVASFSLRDVAMSGITAAATAGFAKADLLGKSEVFTKTMTDTCASITTAQLTEITLGLRHDFDWKELFTAVATAGLNQGLNQAGLNADNVDQFNKPTGTKNILNNTVQGGLDSVATSLLYTGNVDTDNLLIQLSGTAVGTKVGNSLFNAFAPTPEQMAAATKPSQKNDQDSKNPISSPDQNRDLPAARKQAEIMGQKQKELDQYKANANQRYEDAQKGRTSVNEVANRANSKVQTTNGSNSMNGKSRLQASNLSMSPKDIQSSSSRINASGINDFNAGASGFTDALQLKGRSLEGTTLLQKFGYFAGATVGLAAGVITGEAEAVLLVRGIEYVQGMGATTSVVKGASEQLGKVGLFKVTRTESNVFHTATNAKNTQSVLDKINPDFFNPKSRFGEAFYVSEFPDTTLAELSHHNVVGVDTVRFNFNSKSAKVLDLTNPEVAKAWGYEGGEITTYTQSLGGQAKASGFNVIRYSSERGAGANLAILNDFDKILEPKMIVPTPKVNSPGL